MERKGFIGGSDIASIMGMSRWKTALQLWAEKTGEVEVEDISMKEAVEMGHELEETVARLFTKRSGFKVRRAPKNYEHSDHSHFRCQVDRLVEGTDELLECKTCSAWKEKEWEGEEIPQEYILQVMWQLGITGRSVGWIAVLIGGQKFVYKKIDFDKELFNNMVSFAIDFWKCVQDKTPPMAVGMDNKFIVELNPDSNDLIQAVEELNTAVGHLQEVKMHINELMKSKDDIEAKLKQSIGDNLGISTSEYVVTWKTQTGARVDIQALKDQHLYEKFLLPSKTRVLRVKLAKKEKAKMTDQQAFDIIGKTL